MTINGTSDAAFGTSHAGAGGVLAGCSSGGGNPTITYSNSVAGSPGSGPNGGTGGDASGLPPFICQAAPASSAPTPVPGGGGGGGYFGGGGGATGYDTCNSSPGGACNDAGAGQGGAGGSSFAANAVQFPQSTRRAREHRRPVHQVRPGDRDRCARQRRACYSPGPGQ